MSHRNRIYTPRRRTRTTRRIRDDVDRLYHDERGALPNFTRLDRRPSHWRRWLIAGSLGTLAVLTIAAWTSFLVFKPFVATSGGGVTVTIEAPANVAVGSEVTYRIRVANEDRVPVARATLELRLPEDFAILTMEPTRADAEEFRWPLGTIPARETRTVTVHGRLHGSPSTPARVEALAIYRPGNFNADFQARASAVTTFAESPLRLTINGPTDAVPGEPVTYTIAYEHAGTNAMPATAMLIDLDGAFALATATPGRPRADELRWPLGEFHPHTKGTVTITGTYAQNARGSLAVRARLAIEPTPGRALTQVDAQHMTNVLGGDVVLIATVNDQTTALDMPPGTPLVFRVALRNVGSAELRGLTVRATLETTSDGTRSALDFGSLQDPANGAVAGEQRSSTVRAGTITWTVATVPVLAALKPGDQQLFTFTLPLRSPEALTPFPKPQRITFTATVDVAATGTVEKPRRITSTPVAVRVVH